MNTKEHIDFLDTVAHRFATTESAGKMQEIRASYAELLAIRDDFIEAFDGTEAGDTTEEMDDAAARAQAHRDGRKHNDPDDPERNGKIAEAEGWGLFEHEGRYDINRDDDSAKFETDADALIFVALKAHEGSKYHRAALELVGREPSV